MAQNVNNFLIQFFRKNANFTNKKKIEKVKAI